MNETKLKRNEPGLEDLCKTCVFNLKDGFVVSQGEVTLKNGDRHPVGTKRNRVCAQKRVSLNNANAVLCSQHKERAKSLT